MSDRANGESFPDYWSAIEVIERDAWLDICAAVPTALVGETGINSQRLRGLGMLATCGIGVVEFNRALGFGLSAVSRSSDLTQAIEWLDANAGTAWAVQPLSGGVAAAEIDPLGLEAVGNGWTKLAMKAPPAMKQADSTEISVEAADRASALSRSVFNRSEIGK